MAEKDPKDILEFVMEIAQWVMMAFGFKEVMQAKGKDEIKVAVKKNFPRLFGFGHADEAIWGSVRTALIKVERQALDRIMEKLTLDERVEFLINLTLMPTEETLDAKGEKESAPEFSDKDRRVMFLRQLIEDTGNCANDESVDRAVASLRANRLVDQGVFSKFQSGAKKTLCGLIGLKDIADLADSEKVAQAISENLMPQIKAYRAKQYTPGWIGKLFGI